MTLSADRWRQMAIEAIANIEVKNYDQQNIRDGAIFMLEQLPPITPTERTGKWVVEHSGNGWNEWTNYTCSECNKKFNKFYTSNYCPNCGVKMKDGEK